ncbi:hypothetical protein GmHk_07G020151 [Glycine max]|nr:hypothetical protein GmHk_07G020151 [Glycine max]
MKIHVGVACYTCNYFLGTLHFHTSIDNPLHMVSVSYHSHDFFYCCAFLFLFRVLRRATEEVNETNSEIEDVNEAVTDTETEDKDPRFKSTIKLMGYVKEGDTCITSFLKIIDNVFRHQRVSQREKVTVSITQVVQEEILVAMQLLFQLQVPEGAVVV